MRRKCLNFTRRVLYEIQYFKKGFFITLILITFLLTLVVGCATGEKTGVENGKTSETPQPINLSFAHFFPDVHIMSQEIVDGWGKAIEEATDGLVTVTNYPGETLLKADKTYEGVVEELPYRSFLFLITGGGFTYGSSGATEFNTTMLSQHWPVWNLHK